MSRFNYKGIVFDDVILKESEDLNDWSQICQECKDGHNISIDVLDHTGSGICGVEGCNNEAEYYIDFPDRELQEIK